MEQDRLVELLRDALARVQDPPLVAWLFGSRARGGDQSWLGGSSAQIRPTPPAAEDAEPRNRGKR